MKTLQTLFLATFLLAITQSLRATPTGGYVIEWGWNNAAGTASSAEVVLSNAVAISPGGMHCLALKSDGTVVQWDYRGKADFNNLAFTTGEGGFADQSGFHITHTNAITFVTNGAVIINGQILSNVVSIATAQTFSLALKKDGTIVAWGQQARIEDIPKLESESHIGLVDPKTGLPISSENPEINPKTGLPMSSENIKINPVTGLPEPVENPERGHVTRVGILSDGTVATRLDDQNPISLSNVVAIAAVNYFEWALKSDGTVVGWSGQPQNYGGQLVSVANLSNVVAIAAGPGDYNVPVALKKDGTVEEFYHEANNRDTAPPAGLSKVVAVAAGNSYTLALTKDGTVTGWGFNRVGQATGVPTTNAPYISAARQVSIDGHTLSNIVAITAGQGFSMALKDDGTLIAWGRMANDQYPATVPAGLSNVVAIAEGEEFCLAITTNRAVAEKFRQK